MHTLSPQVFSGKENAVTSAPHGKKRSINEVDDPERVEDAKIRVAASPTPPPPAAIALSTAAVHFHTVPSLPLACDAFVTSLIHVRKTPPLPISPCRGPPPSATRLPRSRN
jgi:hypothetical protein